MLRRPLLAHEARVLGTLMEKARTVPDTYPLSLNLVLTGANQKTSREPVMQLSEAEAMQALDGLIELGLASSAPGARVARWQHHTQRALGVPEQSAVILGLLMLRGPQTAGELRLNAERWYRFADISSVEGFLNELAERPDDKGGPLVQRLPRAAGSREDRWMHLLCGVPELASDSIAAHAAPVRAGGGFDHALERIDALEREVAALRAALDGLTRELGLSPAGPAGAAGLATTPDS